MAGQLDLVSDFRLEGVASTLLGGDRIASYQIEYADIDSSLSPFEEMHFAPSILENCSPKGDSDIRMGTLAVANGDLEAGRRVSALHAASLLAIQSSPHWVSLGQNVKGVRCDIVGRHYGLWCGTFPCLSRM